MGLLNLLRHVDNAAYTARKRVDDFAQNELPELLEKADASIEDLLDSVNQSAGFGSVYTGYAHRIKQAIIHRAKDLGVPEDHLAPTIQEAASRQAARVIRSGLDAQIKYVADEHGLEDTIRILGLNENIVYEDAAMIVVMSGPDVPAPLFFSPDDFEAWWEAAMPNASGSFLTLQSMVDYGVDQGYEFASL